MRTARMPSDTPGLWPPVYISHKEPHQIKNARSHCVYLGPRMALRLHQELSLDPRSLLPAFSLPPLPPRSAISNLRVDRNLEYTENAPLVLRGYRSFFWRELRIRGQFDGEPRA